MAADVRPPTIDPQAAARWRRATSTRSPWLHEEVGRRMEERLQWIRMTPQAWADWGPLRGGIAAHELVRRRYPKAAVHVIEVTSAQVDAVRSHLAPAKWSPRRWLGAPIEFGRPAMGGVQLLWSNMALHMSADPQALMREWRDAIAVDGFLMFSCLGPDTLRELRALYTSLGWPVPAHEFTDMHDWGDMLVAAGFAEPVMDMERIVLTWESPEAMLRELRELGRNLHPRRFPALRGKGWHRRLLAALGARLADPTQGGRLALTFEVIYGHAFRPVTRVPVEARTEVSLDEMRALLRRREGGPLPGHEPEI